MSPHSLASSFSNASLLSLSETLESLFPNKKMRRTMTFCPITEIWFKKCYHANFHQAKFFQITDITNFTFFRKFYLRLGANFEMIPGILSVFAQVSLIAFRRENEPVIDFIAIRR